MASSQKKIILRRLVGTMLHGYLPASGFVHEDHLSYLNLEGRLSTIPLLEIKSVCYVRDFNLSDSLNPERLNRRTFIARPRGNGLWIRITFKDDDSVLEGLAAADTGFLDSLVSDSGVFFSPPDTRANTQRIYVPHSSIQTFQILAVITSPSKRLEGSSLGQNRIRNIAPVPIQDALFEGALDVPPSREKHGRS